MSICGSRLNWMGEVMIEENVIVYFGKEIGKGKN